MGLSVRLVVASDDLVTSLTAASDADVVVIIGAGPLPTTYMAMVYALALTKGREVVTVGSAPPCIGNTAFDLDVDDDELLTTVADAAGYDEAQAAKAMIAKLTPAEIIALLSKRPAA